MKRQCHNHCSSGFCNREAGRFLKTSSAFELLDLQRDAGTLLRPCSTLFLDHAPSGSWLSGVQVDGKRVTVSCATGGPPSAAIVSEVGQGTKEPSPLLIRLGAGNQIRNAAGNVGHVDVEVIGRRPCASG